MHTVYIQRYRLNLYIALKKEMIKRMYFVFSLSSTEQSRLKTAFVFDRLMYFLLGHLSLQSPDPFLNECGSRFLRIKNESSKR